MWQSEGGGAFKDRGTTYFYLDFPHSQPYTLRQTFYLAVKCFSFSTARKFWGVTLLTQLEVFILYKIFYETAPYLFTLKPYLHQSWASSFLSFFCSL